MSFDESRVINGSVQDFIQDFRHDTDKINLSGLGLTNSSVRVVNQTISGVNFSTVGVDANNNGAFDNGEFAISVRLVTGSGFVNSDDWVV